MSGEEGGERESERASEGRGGRVGGNNIVQKIDDRYCFVVEEGRSSDAGIGMGENIFAMKRLNSYLLFDR